MKRIISMILLSITVLLPAYGQNRNSFEEYKKKKNAEFNNYKNRKVKEFEEYRRKRNEEFAEYLRKTWIGKKASPKKDRPKDDPMPPVVFDDEKQVKKDPVPIPYKDVVPAPKPTPQPQPVEPIQEVPTPDPKPVPSPEPDPKQEPTPKPEPKPVVTPKIPTQHFTFYGTPAEVRFDKENAIRLCGVNENAIADAWLKLSEDAYTNIVFDCLELRKKYNLSDWAYLIMIKNMSESIFGKNTNEATLLTAFVYCQSGYKMRLAIKDNSRLVMLYASKHTIFDQPYFTIDGDEYYCFQDKSNSLRIADVKYPKESSMSLVMDKEPQFNYKSGPAVKRVSERYNEMETNVSVNQNLINFFNDYPNSQIGENPVSRWAIYANVPLAEDIKKQLYPTLKSAIQNSNTLEAANKLLNYVQTGFVYEYDDKVWGHDRAFFAEESLHYPYCDCEDRSILFSRLVRDILGLNVILVYYPGHLATAVEFPGNVYGDYIEYNGRKFTVCDPTYIGAPVGTTMPKMDNQKAQVILLNK